MTTTTPEPVDRTLILRLSRQQEALIAIGQLWRRYEGDLKKLFRDTTEISAHALNIERVSVWRYDSEIRSLLCEDLYEAAADRHSEGVQLAAEQYPAYFAAMETEEVIPAEDAVTDPHTCEFAESYLKPQGIGAMLDTPIHAGGRLYGVLCHEHVGNTRVFHADEINTATYLANMIGAAVEYNLRLEQHRKVEELLRDEVTIWRILVEQSRDGIVIIDQQCGVYEVNQCYADMLGYSMAEFEKLHVWDWDVNFSKDQILEMLRTVGMSGDHFETKQRRKDGSVIDVEISTNGATYKGNKLIFCICRDVTERNQILNELEQHRIVVENSNTVLFRWRAEPGWPMDLVSNNVRQFGYEPDDLLSGAVDFASMVYPDDLDRVAAEVQHYNESGAKSFEQEYRIVCTDGRVRWIYDRTTVERNDDGRAHHFQGIVIDITERKEAEERLRRSEERLHRIASQVPGVLYQFRTTPEGERSFPYLSEGIVELAGISHDDLSRDTSLIFSLILPEDIETVEAVIAESALTMQPVNTQFRIRHPGGSIRWIEARSIPQREADGSILWHGIFLNITRRKQAEDNIRVLATTDGLTGIANRTEFTRILEKEVERVKRYGKPLSLIMYDLDHFKRINDTHGHDAGDHVLQTVARLATENIRSIDTAGRWGGEEFMVLLPESALAAAGQTAEKLRQVIEQHSFGKIGTVTASFGISEFCEQDDLNALLKRVDDALYQAKNNGRNRVEAVIKP